MYLHSVDVAGHMHGWMTDAYLQQVERVDAIFGAVLDGLGPDATVLATADHGGHDTVHGVDQPEDMLIPWMIAGPGIRSDHRLGEVGLLDVAPTLATVMGLPVLRSWQGRPIDEAFAD